MMHSMRCITIVVFFLRSVIGQVDIEIYDANAFKAKTDSSLYSPNVYPKQEKPVVVNVSLLIGHFGPYDETNSKFSMTMQVHLTWCDERLAITSNEANVSSLEMRHFKADKFQMLNIWRPSIYYSNANMLNSDLLSDRSEGQILGKITKNGKVYIVKRVTLTGSCKANTKLYPADLQQCTIQLESANSDKLLHLQWVPVQSIVMSKDFSWGNLIWVDHALLNSRVSYQMVDSFNRLEAIFILRRQLGYFLLNVYLPSALFVISSWVSFWIHIPAAPARVTLVLTTMLSHVTSSKTIHDKLPRISFIHSLDVWVMVCTMFIFASLVEYGTANYFFHKHDRNKHRNKTNKKSKPANTVEEGTLSGLEDFDTITQISNGMQGTDNKKQWKQKMTQKLSPVGRAWKKMLHVAIPPYDQHIETRKIAMRIDQKARFIFPLSFLLFNVLYWSILLYYSYKTRNPFE